MKGYTMIVYYLLEFYYSTKIKDRAPSHKAYSFCHKHEIIMYYFCMFYQLFRVIHIFEVYFLTKKCDAHPL